jgi:hypothetical protein
MHAILVRLATTAVMNRRGGVRPWAIVALIIGVLGAVLVPVVIPSVALLLIVTAGGQTNADPNVVGCATSATVNARTASTDQSTTGRNQLGDAQIANAAAIIAIGNEFHVPAYGQVIALAAALQESVLVNVTRAVNADSLGVFQQRPSAGWGTAAQITDVGLSARAFYGIADHTHNPGLLDVPNWQQLTVGQAAQAVQRSAFPTLYADDELLARQLVTELGSSTTGADQCGTGNALTCPPTGLALEAELTPDALRVLRCLHQQFPQLTDFIGNYAARGDSDHNTGRAVDSMVPGWDTPAGNALGWQIATWERAHASALGIKYLIFDDKIWSPHRDAEGWRPYANPYGDGGPSGRHLNHVHTSVYGNTAGQSDGPIGNVGLPVGGPFVLGAAFGECGSHWSNCHTGQDFVVPTGTTVLAVTSGVVVGISNGGPYGRLTRLDHGNGVQTWYAHQSAQDVTVGQRVTVGQAIGVSGATGNVTGPHLHLEVRIGGTPVDPVGWLRDHGADPATPRR